MTAFLNSTAFWPGVEWSWDVWAANIAFGGTTVVTIICFFKPASVKLRQRVVLFYLWFILVLHMFAMIW